MFKWLSLPYEWQIGLRYTRASKRSSRNSFISFISLISMGGITLGVAALIIVLSVMNGFQKEVRDRMLSVLSHIEVISDPVWGSNSGLAEWLDIAKKISTNAQVQAVAPYVEAQAMITHASLVRGVIVRGVDPQAENHVSDIGKQMVEGQLTALKPDEFGIVLGRELALALGLKLGDKISMIAPEGSITLAGVIPRIKQFKLIGIFSSGHYEYDSSLALIHMQDAKVLFRKTGPTGLRVKLFDINQAPFVAEALSRILPNDVYVTDWTKQNKNWFIAVQTEKRMMFIILMLIIAVATFNLVSSLVMTVTDKQADIAILKTLGAQTKSIMTIFMVQGMSIGLTGALVGVGLGCLVSINIGTIVPFIEQLFGVHFLPQSVYFINELPSELHIYDVIQIGVIAFLLSCIATLYPSWHASRTNPAEALRYE